MLQATSRSLVFAVLLVVSPLWTGCASDTPPANNGASRQIRGQVIEVEARNISEVETLRIRDDSGQEFVFTTEAFIGFTPSHLKEHQLFGRPVLVTYQEKSDRLVAVKVED